MGVPGRRARRGARRVVVGRPRDGARGRRDRRAPARSRQRARRRLCERLVDGAARGGEAAHDSRRRLRARDGGRSTEPTRRARARGQRRVRRRGRDGARRARRRVRRRRLHPRDHQPRRMADAAARSRGVRASAEARRPLPALRGNAAGLAEAERVARGVGAARDPDAGLQQLPRRGAGRRPRLRSPASSRSSSTSRAPTSSARGS